ncbi:hypothetical protein TPHA_0C02630 [Tetrapisispora phaffii CBS 4417]|uniref:DASH complex subunit ASK1 n=1 Tax=Tetrapisispora phaffii (strain ATCC 24235 / CBS 4417 / NBRC 1672 / NRRL Y-8282 / UCD 70-5) TaxID=1071381 RepID=G8BRP0_TETPH|nr:hypothetical protein TPHA_0C02630 [Tetrapisispora phaffii CBS 4417]CCE62416.1 hypothetical protein TPHA_0C02630 [Tetrapisispora phaffii CBS 4417]
MASQSPEEQLEKLEQEITIHLQKIDSNFSYCFNKITQDIVPHVQGYGEICEKIIDSSSWLMNMFQQSGNIDLNSYTKRNDELGNNTLNGNKISHNHGDTLFPSNNSTVNNNTNSGVIMVSKMPEMKPTKSNDRNSMREENSSFRQDYYTADITSDGKILKVPDSSDEENARDADMELGSESTIQRQNRKRKVSLLLQEEYGSSSVMGSPFAEKQSARKRLQTTQNEQDEVDSNQDSDRYNSSPMKESLSDHESTKEAPKPGTVIHFTTQS